MEWFLKEIFSPLLLPLFLIMIFSAIAGAKPESIVKMVIDAVVSTVNLFVALVLPALSRVIRIFIKITIAFLGWIFCNLCQACRNYSDRSDSSSHPGKTKYPPSDSGYPKAPGKSKYPGPKYPPGPHKPPSGEDGDD